MRGVAKGGAATDDCATLEGVKLLLVDDHKIMRDGLRALLEREGFTVAGEAGDGREALEVAETLRPDLAIMDISMPGLNGVEATRRLTVKHPDTKVIGLSVNADRRYVTAMFDAGASGYLLKNSAVQELVLAIRTVMGGLTYISPTVGSTIVGRMIDLTASGTRRQLSAREREVLQLVAEGKSSKEIASTLGLAVPTVETHRRQLMDKLNLHTVAGLTKYAIREGLTSLD